MLRRVKEDVAKDFPSKEETLIDVELNVLIIDSYYANLDGDLYNSITIGEENHFRFELQAICCTYHPRNNHNTVDGEIYARHGKYHKSWWYQKRSDYIRIQLKELNDLKPNRPYILLYSKIEDKKRKRSEMII